MQFAKHIENSAYLKSQLEEIYNDIQNSTKMIEAIDLDDSQEFGDSGTSRYYWQCLLNTARAKWHTLIRLNDATLVVKAFNIRYKTDFKARDLVEITKTEREDSDIWRVRMSNNSHGLISNDFLADVENIDKPFSWK